MNIPRRIKILGHKYRVKFTLLNLKKNTTGDACVNIGKIRIDSTVTRKSSQAEAFMHEITEILKYHLSIEITHNNLSALSEGLYQVIHDNKLRF